MSIQGKSFFGKVVVASGHMIDAPSRKEPRFPPVKEALVRIRIAQKLDEWQIGKGDLAICGGAQGADILFAECCADLGAQVYLMLPLPQAEFLTRSVHREGADWEQRYFELLKFSNVSVFFLEEFVKKNPEALAIADNVFAKNNLWIIQTAMTARGSGGLFAILVWDEQMTGDGPGGTSDFAARIQEAKGDVAVINPTKL